MRHSKWSIKTFGFFLLDLSDARIILTLYTSENKMKELIDIQQKLKVAKNQENKFGKYKYRSCEDILEALKPLLGENKCYLSLTDEIVLIGDRFYVKAIALMSNGSENCLATGMAREGLEQKGMSPSQITGAASSYARKYALNGLFAIDDNKDSDYTNEQKKEKVVDLPSVQDVTNFYNEMIKDDLWNYLKPQEIEGLKLAPTYGKFDVLKKDAGARKTEATKNA